MRPSSVLKTGTISAIFLSGLAFLLLLVSACSPPPKGPRADTLLLLERLGSPVAPQRDSALRVLPSFVFLEQDAPALKAALQDFSSEGEENQRIRAQLLTNWAPLATVEDLNEVMEWYSLLEKSPQDQQTMLRIIADLGTPQGLAFLQQELALVDDPSSEWIAAIMQSVEAKPVETGELLSWWQWADSVPAFQAAIWDWSARIIPQSINPDSLAKATPFLMQTYVNLVEVRKGLKPVSASAREVDYKVYTLMSLLRHFAADPAVNNVLQAAPYKGSLSTQIAAIRAFTEHDFPVADSSLERLAANPLSRKQLLVALETAGHSRRFPVTWRTRSSLAAGDLSQWLLSEGWFPERIRLIDSVQIGQEQAIGWMYRFQFRSRGTRYQGFSGPQPLDDPEGISTGVYTGSPFEPFRGRPRVSDYQKWLDRADAPVEVVE